MTDLDAQVEKLLAEMDLADPGSYQLGTPELPETEALQSLVGLGTSVGPYLVTRLAKEQSAKRVAFIVLALNRIGYSPALEQIEEVLSRYEGKQEKNVFDYAAIGQCRLAIERFIRSSQ